MHRLITAALRGAGFLIVACLALMLLGCQTPQAFPTPGADWTTHTGQLQYRSAEGRSVIGDVVLRSSPAGDFQLDFRSGPGFPLLRIWQSGASARAEGVFARGTWQGRAAVAPAPLHGWMQLRGLFASLPARSSSYQRPPWRVNLVAREGRPERVEFNSAQTGERFVFLLAR